MHARWTFGNALLAKTETRDFRRIACFALPADLDFEADGTTKNTCPGALDCRGVCYAKQGRYLMPSVAAVRQHNLRLSLHPNFVGKVIQDIWSMVATEKRAPITTIRLHDSGDFYEQRYLDDWSRIATVFPGLEVYAYTKSHHLDFGGVPSNLRIIQSLGGRHDGLVNLNRQHSRIFTSHEDRERAGYVDGGVGDGYALDGEVKLGQVYHGSKPMTDAQRKHFR